MVEDTDGRSTPGRRSKVARLIDTYDMVGMGDRLEERWTDDDGDRWSLRDLADHFNQELLAATLRQVGTQPLGGEITNTYQLLTDDTVSSADRTRAVRRLEREGVDVESLRERFVSYQAIRTYLKSERDATYDRTPTDRVPAAKRTIDQLRGRLTSVTEDRLDQLDSTGELSVGSVSTLVDVRVRCDDCGEQYTVDELLDRGRCGCDIQ